MYLSHLLIDVGDNPDRPNWHITRRWLRNLYRVHQRLCMAFMSEQRKTADREFLQPYSPQNVRGDQVHVQRAAEQGFLFRIDPLGSGRVMILVQSAVEPDWEYAFHNAGHFLAADAATKKYDPYFVEKQRLRFRLVANPTRKVDTKSLADGKRRHGKRVPVPSKDELEAWNRNNPHNDIRPFIQTKFVDWLIRRSESGGFAVERESTNVQPGYVYIDKGRGNEKSRIRSARYDGIFEVTDVKEFGQAIVQGIGPAKAFGFGLLSVAPISESALKKHHENPRPSRAAEIS